MKPARALAVCVALATLGGCRLRTGGGESGDPAATRSPGQPAATASLSRSCSSSSTAAADASEPPPRPLRRCFPDRPAWLDAPVASLLDRAAELFDDSDYAGALACAEEAARQAPRSVEAHH